MKDIRSVQDRDWPPLPLDAWRETYTALHLWTQVVGKVRLALAPMVNHWWQVPLYVTCRGLTTSTIPHGRRVFHIDFDFLDHRLVVGTGEGAVRQFPLEAMSVARFYRQLMDALGDLDLDVSIWPVPVEMPGTPVSFDRDDAEGAYDTEDVERFRRILIQTDRIFRAFRARFLGKSSPVHFFWGAFDLAVTRFSGREAPPHPGGIPNVADAVMREAYSHEVSSAGFWPGGGSVQEPVFYAYAYPEPPGFREHGVRPSAAFYHPEMREFILPYDAVRSAPDPDEMLLDFLQTTYAAAADLAAWDRRRLERRDFSRRRQAPRLS